MKLGTLLLLGIGAAAGLVLWEKKANATPHFGPQGAAAPAGAPQVLPGTTILPHGSRWLMFTGDPNQPGSSGSMGTTPAQDASGQLVSSLPVGALIAGAVSQGDFIYQVSADHNAYFVTVDS